MPLPSSSLLLSFFVASLFLISSVAADICDCYCNGIYQGYFTSLAYNDCSPSYCQTAWATFAGQICTGTITSVTTCTTSSSSFSSCVVGSKLGVIIGGAVAGLVAICICVGIAICVMRRNKAKAATTTTTTYVTAPPAQPQQPVYAQPAPYTQPAGAAYAQPAGAPYAQPQGAPAPYGSAPQYGAQPEPYKY